MHLRGLARGDGQRVGQRGRVVKVAVRLARRALQLGDLVLEDVGRGVHDSRVDGAELSEGKQLLAVLGGLELKRRALEDRNRAGTVVGVD